MSHLSDIIYDHNPLIMLQTATVKAACQQMSERSAEYVLIADEEDFIVGIFTGRDAVNDVLAAGKNASKTTLSQVMTPNPVTMSPDNTSIEALRLMWDCDFRHVPLMQGGRLLGVVSRNDFKGEERTRHEEERELWEYMR